MDLSICIVNWNTKDLLSKCLYSIYSNISNCNFEILVVDNASTDGSPQMVREKFSQVKLIENGTNVGFPKALNKALRASKGRYKLSLHPDTIVTLGALDKLVKFMNNHPETGAAGAKLIYPDGSINRSCFHFPSLTTEFYKCFWLNKLFKKSKIFGWHEMSYWNHNGIQEVGWLSSSCLMMREETINQVGMLDENYFVWTADVDWCYQAKQKGWKIYYVPDSKMIHYERQSFMKTGHQKEPHLTYKENMYYIDEKLCLSTYYFFEKSYGKKSAKILRRIMLLERINKIIVCLLIYPFQPTRRDEIGERLQAYWKSCCFLSKYFACK